jgi:hypothetical protein
VPSDGRRPCAPRMQPSRATGTRSAGAVVSACRATRTLNDRQATVERRGGLSGNRTGSEEGLMVMPMKQVARNHPNPAAPEEQT